MEKKKVLQVIGSLRVGGAETVAVNYYKYINKSLFEFHYLVYGDDIGGLEEEVYRLGGKVIHIPSPRRSYSEFVKNVRKVLREYGPYDIVHSHPLFNSGIIVKAAYHEKVPKRISHAHSARSNVNVPLAKKFYALFMKYRIRRYSTRLVACSNAAGNYLFDEKYFYKDGCVIKNGIDTEKYLYNGEIRDEVREELVLNGKFVIGHVGRLSDVKNQEFILDIFKIIKNKHENALLMLVGEGETEKQLRLKVERLGLIDDVKFMGSRNDVERLLQVMDVFLFPSKYEGLGIAVIEAQAAGLQCIISDSVPSEVVITNLVDKVSLIQSSQLWAEQVMKYYNGYKRTNTLESLSSNGYDIHEVIKVVEHIYG